MKNKILITFMIMFTSFLFTMCGTDGSKNNNEQVSSYDETITLENMSYNEESDIYDLDYQKDL